MGAVDLQIHHGGTLVEVDAGDTHQPADGGLTQMLLVTAVVGHSVAGDGAVGDAAVAHAAVVVIGDAHQPAQGVGGGILAHRPGAAGGRGIGIALDDGAVVTIKDDVRDLCAGGGAEEAHVVAVGVDVHVLDIVALAVVFAAEPVVQHHTVVAAAAAVVDRAGDGMEAVIQGGIRGIR